MFISQDASLVTYLVIFITDWQTTVTSSILQSIPTFGKIIPSTSQAPSSASCPSLTLLNNQPIFTGTNLPYLQDIPAKIVKKILDLEYTDTADLIQDNWEMEEPKAHCCGSSQNKGPQCKSISNIRTWLMVAVLCSIK